MILQELPPLLGRGLRQGDGKTLGLALDLAAPPLALLAMGVLGVVGLAGWLADLASVPFYVLTKIPLYLKFWTRRQKEWVRTERK